MSGLSRGGDYRYNKPTSIGEPEKVTSWPFKEPEKTSAWNKEPAAANDARIELRDYEKDTAEKRTAMIKARMSPPGALNLPPLLEAQRLKYGIPDGFFKSQALFDRIFVFPIDLVDDDHMTNGSLIIRPQVRRLKDLHEGNRGVLISAGLTAADRLMSHGIELGHIVTTNKNVPFARRCDRLEDGTDMFFLVMRDGDLAGSETLADELREGKKRIEEVGGEDAYSHQVAWNDNGDWTYRKKQSVWVADNW
jgi:hypothetical protein